MRYCDRTVTHVKAATSNTWVGDVADQATSSNNYTETDTDFYEPCPDNTSDSEDMMWAGLGGHYFSSTALVQTGTWLHRYWNGSGWYNDHEAFVENTGDGANSGVNTVFRISCNDHMYAKVWGGNCMFVEDLNNGWNSGNKCYGPNADGSSAEEIGERPQDPNHYASGIAPLADFHTVTFYGVGVTANGNYIAMNSASYDYENMWSTDYSHELATVSQSYYDAGDPPYDQYSVTWAAQI